MSQLSLTTDYSDLLTCDWDRQTRYTPLNTINAATFEQLKAHVAHAPWRLSYHIQPPCGLMNDPNGFCYFNGEYHLFYQWFPLGPVHGLKHWYHVKSKNLVHWIDCAVALIPNETINSHGAYSGSGFVLNDELYFFYTANRRNEKWIRSCSQVIAKLMPNGQIQTVNDAISAIPVGYTEHFRDPKVWQEGEQYYAVIGAQRANNQMGTCVLYHSENGIDWQSLGELETSLSEFGYMWECPDYFVLTEQNISSGVLIFSPQGLREQSEQYQNIYQSGYIVGKPLSLPDRIFSHGDFHELDFGFDFYAPQTTQSADGKRILIAWMGLPEISYPSDKDGWAHCLTLPREITLVNGRIYQHPLAALTILRQSLLYDAQLTDAMQISQSSHFEMILSQEEAFDSFELMLFASSTAHLEMSLSEKQGLFIRYDSQTHCLTIDRTYAGIPFAVEYGTQRKYRLSQPLTHLQIFGDTSTLELFANQGEATASLRHFSKPENNHIHWLGSCANIKLWQY